MKKGILSLITLFLLTQINGQNLTTTETLKYINDELTTIGATDVYGNKIDNHVYKLQLTNDGYLKLEYIHTVKDSVESQQEIHINDVASVEINKFGGLMVRIECSINNCCRNEDFLEDKTTSTNDLSLKVPYKRSGERLKNALDHLITQAKRTYSTKDPFAPENGSDRLKSSNN